MNKLINIHLLSYLLQHNNSIKIKDAHLSNILLCLILYIRNYIGTGYFGQSQIIASFNTGHLKILQSRGYLLFDWHKGYKLTDNAIDFIQHYTNNLGDDYKFILSLYPELAIDEM